ncbi:hypothetical protein SSX86_013004 [Deinandra increscens subsp. villosa]|uniref:Mitochondrial glycoprotein n=1 Tax=Deinandra increscens subsp. villosa TaxID=3103831 RepID=A0AAP0DCW7_9ASTR
MAFTSVLRRSASALTPLAGRLLSGQRNLHHHCGGAFFVAMNHTHKIIISNNSSSLVTSFRGYCSSANSPVLKPPSSDDSLIKVLESEINCSEQSFEQDEDIPKDFPFKLDDISGMETVILTREYEGETIKIEVEPSDLVIGDSSSDDDAEKDEPSTLPMVVKVSKTDGPFLEFEISVHPGEIVIDSLSVKIPDLPEDGIRYEGPKFDELDEKIQNEFLKYLEKRGIKASAMKFLHGYTVNKAHREYANWLKNAKEFLEA